MAAQETPLKGLEHLKDLHHGDRCLIIGIDPGLKGALAITDQKTGELVAIYDMPTYRTPSKSRRQGFLEHLDVHRLSSFVDMYAPFTAYAVLEEPGAMPNQGLSSTFRFGKICGQIHGVLAGHYIPTFPVKPGPWKMMMGVTANKDSARELTDKLYPKYKNLWKRKKDADRSEAILLSLYGAKVISAKV